MVLHMAQEGLLTEAHALCGELQHEYSTTFRAMMSALHAP
jgi:hypothetical protein